MTENSWNETEVRLQQLFNRAASSRADAIALVSEDRRISFFELQLYVEWMVGYFQSINLQPGQRVALLMANSPKLVISLFGLWHAGGVAVPLEVTSDEATLHSQLALAGVSVIVTAPEYQSKLERALAKTGEEGATRSPFTIAIFEEDNIVTLNAKLRNRRSPTTADKSDRPLFAASDAAADHVAAIYFAADLESRVITHEELARAAAAMVARMELSAHDGLICLAPLAQENNLSGGLLAAIVAGSTLIIAETNDWDKLEERFADESATVAVGPAALLLRLAKSNAAKLATLRWYFYTDVALSPEIGERLPRRAGLQIEPLTDALANAVRK